MASESLSAGYVLLQSVEIPERVMSRAYTRRSPSSVIPLWLLYHVPCTDRLISYDRRVIQLRSEMLEATERRKASLNVSYLLLRVCYLEHLIDAG